MTTTDAPVEQPEPHAPEQVRRTEVDGVPVFWAPGPAPLSAGLVFGVGRRDETFAQGGLTHLVEHLAMHAVPTHLDANAGVDLTTTEFTVTGRPEQVVDVLQRVCAGLSDLPVHRLAVEVDVLRTEEGAVAPPVVGALLAARYGARGAGLAGFTEPALGALAPDDVLGWAARRFVRGAAALWLSGPPPAGLRLPLRDGPAPQRPPQPVLPLTLPALVPTPEDGRVALGAELPQGTPVRAACRVLGERLRADLRTTRGLTYTVQDERLPVAADRCFAVVTADCRPGSAAVVARGLWSALGALAAQGPTEAELAVERQGLADLLADPRSGVLEAQAAAHAHALGAPHLSAERARREMAALTVEQVRHAAQAMAAGALLGVPEDVDVAPLQPVPPWSATSVQGTVFRRRRGSDAPPRARFVVGEQGVSVLLGDGETLTVRYDDAVGLLELGPGDLSLVGGDGVAVPVCAADWRDGDRAVELVLARVPAHLRVVADVARTDGRRALLLKAPPGAVTDALWPSSRELWVLSQDRWSLVVRDQDQDAALADAAGLSAALGRRHAVLLLEAAHGELGLVALHRGKERDRHLWTGQDADPAVLADLLGADPAAVGALLAARGGPAEVLEEAVRVLGLPRQVVPVLTGTPLDQVPGLVHHEPRGLRASFLAAVRGEYDPPDSAALHHRLARAQRERSRTHRLRQGGGAVVQAAVAAVLAADVDGDWLSWPAAGTAVLGVAAVRGLWQARPPARRAPAPGGERPAGGAAPS